MESLSPSPAHSRDIRFSLRTALVAISAVCLLLAPTQWFGAAYLISATLSATLVLVCALLYRSSTLGAVGAAIMAVFAGLVLAFGIMVFFFHAVLNAFACAALAPLKLRPRTFAAALVAVMVAIYSFCFYQGFAKWEELQTLREKYPFVSLAPRLSFEKSASADTPITPPPVQLASHVATNLSAQEQAQRANYFSRAGALQQLHENYQDEFSRAAGFGISRMPSITYRIVDFNDRGPLSLPAPVRVPQLPTSTAELYNVHRAAADTFTSPERFGYVKNRNSVAGFLPHQIASFDNGCDCSVGTERYWQIVRLELVGLLRSNDPRVYTAKTLPSMDQIADTPHRELNDFESAALPKLVSLEDLIVDQTPEHIQMLGALRAGKTCLECHEGQRGKLLGAFSYELTPVAHNQTIPATEPRSGDGA